MHEDAGLQVEPRLRLREGRGGGGGGVRDLVVREAGTTQLRVQFHQGLHGGGEASHAQPCPNLHRNGSHVRRA